MKTIEEVQEMFGLDEDELYALYIEYHEYSVEGDWLSGGLVALNDLGAGVVDDKFVEFLERTKYDKKYKV